MAKPKRKHPGLYITEGSPRGKEFLDEVAALLAGPAQYQAIETDRDGTHYFAVLGSRVGMLIEPPWTHHEGCLGASAHRCCDGR